MVADFLRNNTRTGVAFRVNDKLEFDAYNVVGRYWVPSYGLFQDVCWANNGR